MSDRHQEDAPLRRVILLRHGRTSWNAEGRWQGREDIPLDASGLRQAERAAAALVRDGAVTRIVTSPARRAAQTAAVLKGAFDLAGRPVALDTDPRLVEVDVGRWTGLTHDDVAATFGDEYAAIQSGRDVPYGEDGERLSEASERARQAVLAAVESTVPGGTVMIVMHGAVLRGVVADLVGIPLDAFKRSFASMGNCRWTTMIHDADGWVVETWNAGA